MASKVTVSIPEQVRTALDGRTQRWLALEVKMSEDMLSKKMQGLIDFTEDELKRINERLSSNIKK